MQKRVLAILADPDTRTSSFSSSVKRAFLDELRANEPDCNVTEMNLYEIDFPFLDLTWIEMMESPNENTSQRLLQSDTREEQQLNQLLNQLEEADALVFISRSITFGLPAKMKAFVELLVFAEQVNQLNGISGKNGLHIQIVDDMLSPTVPPEDKENFKRFLTNLSVNMADTLVLRHGHHKQTENQLDSLSETIEEARNAASKFVTFIYR